MRRCLLSILLLATVFTHADQTGSMGIDEKFDKLHALENKVVTQNLPYQELSTRLQDSYSTLAFTEAIHGDLSAINNADLKLLFRGASLTAFYSSDPAVTADMGIAFQELARRGLMDERGYSNMYQALVTARLLKEAQDFYHANKTRGLSPLPNGLQEAAFIAGDVTEMLVRDNTLKRQSVDIKSGTHVLIVAHPSCHFSRRAVQAITTDESIRRALEGHVRWLAPQDASFDLAIIQKWNQDFPSMPMSIVYKRQEWPIIDHWDLPTFYVIKDSVLVGKVTGWGGGESKAELIAAMKKVDLL